MASGIFSALFHGTMYMSPLDVEVLKTKARLILGLKVAFGPNRVFLAPFMQTHQIWPTENWFILTILFLAALQPYNY